MPLSEPGVDFLVNVADLHAGSALSPCPESFDLPDEIQVRVGQTQTWLRECWEDFAENWVPSITDGHRFGLVLNGDLIEGLHHGGAQVVARSERKQCELAVELLGKLTKRASVIYVVKGTECHTREDEEGIAEEIGAERNSSGYAASDWWDLSIRGCLTSFRHHISTTSRRALGGTALSIALGEEQVNAAGSRSEIPRVVVRAHAHFPRHYQDAGGMAIDLPAWQLLTRHGHKVVPAAQRFLSVGGSVLDYRSVNTAFDLPTYHVRLYRPEREETWQQRSARKRSSENCKPSKSQSNPTPSPRGNLRKAGRAGSVQRKRRSSRLSA